MKHYRGSTRLVLTILSRLLCSRQFLGVLHPNRSITESCLNYFTHVKSHALVWRDPEGSPRNRDQGNSESTVRRVRRCLPGIANSQVNLCDMKDISYGLLPAQIIASECARQHKVSTLSPIFTYTGSIFLEQEGLIALPGSSVLRECVEQCHFFRSHTQQQTT